MSAEVLLASLKSAGFEVGTAARGGLLIQPASRLTDAQREAIREHLAELLGILGRTCRQCTHITRHRTCSEPEAAGLWPRFILIWPPEHHAPSCPGFAPRPTT